MGGATIAVAPQGWNGKSFDFTAFYGAANGAAYSDANISTGDVFQGTIKATRLDFESLAHIPLFGSRWADLNVGARYINGFSNITGYDSINLPFQFLERSNYYIAEVGVRADTTGLFSDNRQQIFGALNLGLGYKRTTDFDICCSGLIDLSSFQGQMRSGAVVAADGFFAYKIRFGDAVFSARFRFQVISQGGFNVSQPTFVYGPEVNFTLPFALTDK